MAYQMSPGPVRVYNVISDPATVRLGAHVFSLLGEIDRPLSGGEIGEILAREGDAMRSGDLGLALDCLVNMGYAVLVRGGSAYEIFRGPMRPQ